MIIVNYFIKNSEGRWVEGSDTFSEAYKAGRFIFMIKRKGACCVEWSCLDPEDNEYLMGLKA